MPQAPNAEILLNIPQGTTRVVLEEFDRKVRQLQVKAVGLASRSLTTALKSEQESWAEGYLAALRDVRRLLEGRRDKELKNLL